jgi:hypothetical protein
VTLGEGSNPPLNSSYAGLWPGVSLLSEELEKPWSTSILGLAPRSSLCGGKVCSHGKGPTAQQTGEL